MPCSLQYYTNFWVFYGNIQQLVSEKRDAVNAKDALAADLMRARAEWEAREASLKKVNLELRCFGSDILRTAYVVGAAVRTVRMNICCALLACSICVETCRSILCCSIDVEF